MILEQYPRDYGMARNIWTAKIIIVVIGLDRWNISLKDSRVYEILYEVGLSAQKAHRDYINGNKTEQK